MGGSMTTPRTRRTKPQQAADILKALLRDQEKEVDSLTRKLNTAVAERDKTKRTVELLETGVVKDFQPTLSLTPGMETLIRPVGEYGTGDDLTHPNTAGITVPQGDCGKPECPVHHGGNAPYCPDDSLAEAVPVPPPNPRPHRQKIGEKAQGISDVWANDGTVSVHSFLMYARQDLCEWCRKGVPFATEKRMEHYVVTKDEAGVERGFSYKSCMGLQGAA